MTTIDWHQEPNSDKLRILRAEVIKVAIDDGLAALGGNNSWHWALLKLQMLCSSAEDSIASDLRSAIRETSDRAATDREARRARDAEALITRARERFQAP